MSNHPVSAPVTRPDVAASIRALQVGESVLLPADKASSVRTTAWKIAKASGRKFSTKLGETGIKVTREADAAAAPPSTGKAANG